MNNEITINDKITLKEKIAYSMANLGNIPIQTLIGAFLLIFYTNVVGLDPAACATLFLIARILDGVNDPFVGFMIDHLPTTKLGQFRPPLIIGTLLCSLNFLLLWFGPMMFVTGKMVIAYISYLLIGILFPVMDISLNSLLPVMTENMKERNILSSVKGFSYTVGMLSFTIAAPLIIGDTSNKDGYIKLILIATAFIVIFSIAGALGVKERVRVKQESRKYSFKDLIKIFTLKPVYATFICAISYIIGSFIMNTVNAYFFTYVIGNLKLFSLAALFQFAALLPATILVAPLSNKFGKKKLLITGLFFFGILPLIRLFNVTNIPLLMTATASIGFGMGICTTLIFSVQADNTDYAELVLGHRAEAGIAALSSFIIKCGMGIGGAVPGYILAITGFNAEVAIQPDSVKTAIVACVAGGPALLCLIGAIIFGLFYPLTKEKLEKQNCEIQTRRGNA